MGFYSKYSIIYDIRSAYVSILLFTILLILAFPFNVCSQNLSVDSFKNVPFDLSSRTREVMDNNHIPCALVKIICIDEITGVQGNVIKTEKFGNELWVYLSSGSKYLKILTQHHKPLDFNICDYSPSGAASQLTYQLELKSDLSPEILYGSSNPLLPVAMSKDGDPLYPKWWNTNEDGMFVGISLPIFDGEMAKTLAISNAIYSFIHSSGCFIDYKAEIEKNNKGENMQASSHGVHKGFSIKISQEYYNSKGEYFVLCALNNNDESPNTFLIDWEFTDNISGGTLTVNLAMQAKINRFPFESAIQYRVYWSDNSQNFSLNCNGKDLMRNKSLEFKDNISDFIISGDLGSAQLRLLTTIPLLTDTISYTKDETISFSNDANISYESYDFFTRIIGSGNSICNKINIIDCGKAGIEFNVSEYFPNISSSNQGNDNQDYIHLGLSKKYLRYYDGESTVLGNYICDSNLFEVAKNNSLLNSLSQAVGYFCTNIMASYDKKLESSYNSSFNYNDNSLITNSVCKAIIYPLYYLDANERVECKDKKFRKEWSEFKGRYKSMTSIMIPIEPCNNINYIK